MAVNDVAAYLAELKLVTGRNNTSLDTLIYPWINNLMEKVEVDPEKLWFLDKTVRFTLGVADVGNNGLVVRMPNDMAEAYGLYLVFTASAGDEYVEIKSLADRDARNKFGPDSTGEPENYSEEGESFRLWPCVPDQTYTFELSYKALLKRVSATADINNFLLNYHATVMAGLQAQAWEYLQQYDKAAYFWAQWNQNWTDLRAANVSRILNGEVTFAPRVDVNATTEDERGGSQLVWGGF